MAHEIIPRVAAEGKGRSADPSASYEGLYAAIHAPSSAHGIAQDCRGKLFTGFDQVRSGSLIMTEFIHAKSLLSNLCSQIKPHGKYYQQFYVSRTA
jgi:hypothetical protein